MRRRGEPEVSDEDLRALGEAIDRVFRYQLYKSLALWVFIALLRWAATRDRR